MNRFLQIHLLTSYPAALLNRDDAGFAKRIPFGDAVRTRISSQCLKRHWRVASGARSLTADVARLPPATIRSRQIFDVEIARQLAGDGDVPEVMLRARWATGAVLALLQVGSKNDKKIKTKRQKVARDFALGEETTTETSDVKGDGRQKRGRAAVAAPKVEDGDEGEETEKDATSEDLTNQVLVLGRPEIDFLCQIARAAFSRTEIKPEDLPQAVVEEFNKKEFKDNLDTLRKGVTRGAGISAALFGRMVTSDVFARCDAAIHVAHAWTVHAEQSEADYFSAMSEILESNMSEQQGSGHINSSELTSGLYYSYVAIDLPLLVSNLQGCAQAEWQKADHTLARKVIENFLHVAATVSPGAKLGSTAPHNYASMVLVEAGDEQPRTLADAFLRAVPTRRDVLGESYAALAAHLRELDAMYGASGRRAHAALHAGESLSGVAGERLPLAKLAAWAAEQLGA